MSWNYRIIHHADGSFALHEVYYDMDNNPKSRTQNPVTFVCDEEEGAQGVIESLKLALESAQRLAVLEDPWPDE